LGVGSVLSQPPFTMKAIKAINHVMMGAGMPLKSAVFIVKYSNQASDGAKVQEKQCK